MSEPPANSASSRPASSRPTSSRKERRIRVRLPVEVRGIDRSGVRFNERTESQDLSRQGAAFVLSHDLDLGADLDILIPVARQGVRSAPPAWRAAAETRSGDFATQARVRHIQSAQAGRVIGVEFIGSHFHRVFLSESADNATDHD